MPAHRAALRTFKQPEQTSEVKRLTSKDHRAIQFRKLVQSNQWQALREEGNELVRKYATSIPTGGIDNLIGYTSYSIVRDAIDQLLARVEEMAENAPNDDDQR